MSTNLCAPIKQHSTFLGVQVHLHSGVSTRVKNLPSMDLQNRHGWESDKDRQRKKEKKT